MRKFLKNNILEIFKTIYEAHEIIKGFIDKKEYESAQNLLADCQDTAIQLGNLIEESEGEGFITVSFLEEYCESLYEAATSLSEESNGYKVQKQLDKKIIKAENSVKNDIQVKLEIVFMPYKASMWDSLESVWKAADEDPDCDAYVVPIPYYDRKPDHSFGEFHYEGGEYPDYVPVVHYETYNLEQRRPDVIYIHNPYDGNNYVTSVDPRFYSSELKKYTDKLVYIPYFVLGEPDPENEEQVEKISHFVITPGVINADKVIVQSEAMRQVYIKALLKRFGDTPNNRKIVEEKIEGTGSPKFDKIANTDKDSLVIPEEWQKIITKSDGTRKKIILYNISVGALLEHNEKMLEKIKSVLEVFYENKDDVALLWRPHPLIKATIESMRPQLWADYKQIVDKYISDGWGIYDNTPDLDRAVALSDGYYGDPSSVTSLFKKMNKLVFTQSMNLTPCKLSVPVIPHSFNNIYFFDAYVENDIMIVSNITYNALFRVNLITHKCDYIDYFKAELDNKILHNKIIAYENYLVFIPEEAVNIAIFYPEKCYIEQIPIPDQNMRAADSALYNNYIYIFPRKLSNNILIFDLNKRTFKEDAGKLSEYIDTELSNASVGKAVFIGNDVWLPVQNSNCIIQYNVESGDVNKIYIDKKYKINHIEYDGLFLWATLMNSTVIIKINLKNGFVDEYTITKNEDTEKPPFTKVIHLRDEQYLVLPAYSENILLIKNNQTKVIPYPSDFSWADDFKNGWSRMLYYKRIKNQIYIFPSVSNMLLIYDIDMESLYGYEVIAPENWDIEYIYQNFLFPQYKERCLSKYGELLESEYWDLRYFITTIKNKINNTVTVNEICGKFVHNMLMNNNIERI